MSPLPDTGGMKSLRHVRTARLDLRAITMSDVDDLYALNSDPRVWTHLPSRVHTRREQTLAQVASAVAAWERDGLGYWTARLADASAGAGVGAFAGVGGCAISQEVVWNVYYRFTPEVQGRGLATELAQAARAAALAVRPDLPVTALLLERNLASKAVAEKLGLRLAWRGPDAGNPCPDAIRLVYADRELTPEVLGKVLHALPSRLGRGRILGHARYPAPSAVSSSVNTSLWR